MREKSLQHYEMWENRQRDIGEEVCAGNAKAILLLVLGQGRLMSDPSVVSDNVVSLDIGQGGDIWVRSRTMVAFIEVFCESLPVVRPFHCVFAVKDIVVKIVLLVSFLNVNTCKIIFPGHFRYVFAVEVDPDESNCVDVDVDTKQAIDTLIEAGELIIFRSLGQLPIKTVGPSMVSAGEYPRSSLLSLNDWKRPVPADIVKRIEDPFSVLADHEFVARDFKFQPVTWL